MDSVALRKLLQAVRDGRVEPGEAERALSLAPYEDLGYARLDVHRAQRQGIPEVVLAEGKSVAQVVGLVQAQRARGEAVLATRVAPEAAAALVEAVPDVVCRPVGRLAWWRPAAAERRWGPVLVVSAGTSDGAVADEALGTLEFLGLEAHPVVDVGVAGLHRLLAEAARLYAARAIIVVAGMDGALPSVVGGLVGAPVVAVPTSVGYGATFAGVAPLLTMLSSCAAGVVVVNIDNGFGAAVAVARIAWSEARAVGEPGP